MTGAQNTGGGPALIASVNPGVPPLAVSSSAKVANLNADQVDGMNSSSFLGANAQAADSSKLDGLDSTQFVQGGGSISVIHTALPPGMAGVLIGTPGGIVRLFASCFNASGTQGARISLENISNFAITFLREGSQGATTAKVLAPSDYDFDMPVLDANHYTWHAQYGGPSFTIDTWTSFDGSVPGAECLYDVRSTFDPAPRS